MRIGIIGCGHWGKNYVRLLGSLPGTELTGVSEIDAAKRDAIQAQYPGLAVAADHRTLLGEGRCDAVVVATPASTHHSIIREALDAGLDVLAEKPVTLSTDQARELADLSRRTGRTLMVAHTFLFNPSVVAIKQYLAEGRIGDVYYIRAQRTHLGLVREDVNAVWDLAPHDVSMFLWWLGESPSSVQAVGRRVLRPDREDAAFANLTFPSGVIASVHVSWADTNKERRVEIVGSSGKIVFDDLNLQEPVRVYHKGISVEREAGAGDFGSFKYLLRDGEIVSPSIPVREPLRALCEEFVAAVRERRTPLSDGEFGCRVVEVLCRIEKALGERS